MRQSQFIFKENKLGSLRLLTANTRAVRTFIFSRPFYSIFQHRRLNIHFGNRPEHLSEVNTIDQKIWEKHQTYLKRLDNHPLKKAEYYLTLKRSKGVNTVRELAEITGEDWSYVAKVLRTLELPQGIRDFLLKNPYPQVIEYFHLRRLLEIVRIKDEDRQMSQFRKIVSELQVSGPCQ